MKKMIIPIIAGAGMTLWFALVQTLAWWELIVVFATAFGSFWWTDSKCKKLWVKIPAMIACAILLRYLILSVALIVATIWIGVISAACSIIGWGFGALGITGGIIILLIVALVIKKLCS